MERTDPIRPLARRFNLASKQYVQATDAGIPVVLERSVTVTLVYPRRLVLRAVLLRYRCVNRLARSETTASLSQLATNYPPATFFQL